MSFRIWCLAGWLLLVPLAAARGGVDAGEAPQVLYMHTEFLPYQVTAPKDIPYRMGREMVRQGFLMAAREELGVVTLDETLGEVPPAEGEVVHLILSERANLGGKWSLKLYRYREGSDWREDEPVWEKTYKYKPAGTQMYREMVPKLEKDSRGEFVEALKTAGLRAVERPEGEQAAPKDESTADIEELLMGGNFITQFAAVRQVHNDVRQQGETPARLGQLARGYANLSLLTQHHWNASSEAFAGRAFAYAQRMAATTNDSPDALRHRAYVWAITGSMHFALDDLKKLKASEPETADAEPRTDWSALTKPYARCNRKALQKLANDVEDLKPWALQLDLQIALAYRYPQWIYQAARDAAQCDPAAFNVYVDLAHRGGTLEGTRTGASYGPYFFGHHMPECLDKIADLPKPIRAVLPLDVVRKGLLGVIVQDPSPHDYFSPLPSYVARELRKASSDDSAGGVSWSALAYLLEEEQFVEAARFLDVSNDGTETSLASLVDGILPLVKEHRYAGYIESYRYNARSEQKEIERVTKHIVARDMRPSMAAMSQRLKGVSDGERKNIGDQMWATASRNFTMQGMLEYCYTYNAANWSPKPASNGTMLARETSRVAPHLEVGTRMTIQTTPSPKLDQLKKWEKAIKIDPDALALLAGHYKRLGKLDDAIRCYEKSLEALPTVNNTTLLANLYWNQKEYDKWEQTLLSYLKTEDNGLEHARIHQRLAYGLSGRGHWAKAKSHAERAGRTWSAWGLQIASYVCEGLGEWEESEQWARAMSENYPTSSGAEWYYWCCRTGRGSEEEALPLAERCNALLPRNPNRSNMISLGMFRLLQGDVEGAREAYLKALDPKPTLTCTMMVAQLSEAMDDLETRDRVIATMQARIDSIQETDEYTSDPGVFTSGLAILELIKTKDASPERLADVETKLASIKGGVTRCAFCYFLAAELDAIGHAEEAEKYWRRALNHVPREPIYATLAGRELSMRFGTSRPENDMLDESDLWPPRDENYPGDE